MNTELPLSPTSSEATSFEPIPGEAQSSFPSVRESLPSYGISIEKAESWKREYNRCEIPVMHDEEFWEVVAECAKDFHRAVIPQDSHSADIESKLKALMDQKNTRFYKDFEAVVFEPLMYDYVVFPNPDQRFIFSRALDIPLTLHNIESLISKCLPYLTECARKCMVEPPNPETISGSKTTPKPDTFNKPKTRSKKKTATKSKAQKHNQSTAFNKRPVTHKISKQSSGTRHSLRIANLQKIASVK